MNVNNLTVLKRVPLILSLGNFHFYRFRLIPVWNPDSAILEDLTTLKLTAAFEEVLNFHADLESLKFFKLSINRILQSMNFSPFSGPAPTEEDRHRD